MTKTNFFINDQGIILKILCICLDKLYGLFFRFILGGHFYEYRD